MINIIIDTREQTPWAFPRELATVQSCKLDAGDYALAEDPGFAIERKSLDDFAGTISSGWQRFERELDRMRLFPVQVMIVEGKLLDCCFWETDDHLHEPIHNHFRVQPQFVLRQIACLTMRGVSVLFADNADVAAGLGYAILKERAQGLNDKD